MSEHTPGPWIEYEGQPGWVGVFPKPVPGHGSVAVALVRDGRPESVGNSRLIAAAPTLLEALQEAVQCIEPGVYPDAYQGARAAIALATKGSPA